MDNTKTCGICGQLKPADCFYEGRNQCGECMKERARVNYQNRSGRVLNEKNNRVHLTLHDARRALVIAIIYQSYLDGSGQGILSEEYRRFGQEGAHRIMMDGLRFFEDGRFKHFAELIDLCPDMRPKWPGSGEGKKVRVR